MVIGTACRGNELTIVVVIGTDCMGSEITTVVVIGTIVGVANSQL